MHGENLKSIIFVQGAVPLQKTGIFVREELEYKQSTLLTITAAPGVNLSAL